MRAPLREAMLARLTPRKLSLFDATMMVMGGIIGVGIFFTPASVAAAVPHEGLFLGLWAVGGLIAMCGAFTFAELSGTWPREGGWYVFLRESFGRFPAYLFAWVVLFAVSTGAIAVMIHYFTLWLLQLVGSDAPVRGPLFLAIGASAIVGVTALTMLGVKVGATFQNVCMLTKLAAIAAMALIGLLFFQSTGPQPALPAPVSGSLTKGCIDAVLPVLFTCGGWQMLSYIAPQVRDPQKTLPRAIVIGVLGVVATYLLINCAYLRVLGLGGFAGQSGFASTMAERTLGPIGSRILLGALTVSAIGICTVNIIATPWMYVAMAREGLFFQRFARLQPKTGAPLLALTLQLCVCLVYWFWGKAEVLTNAVVFVEWVFHALVAWALLSVRWKRPDLPRPFRSPLWPLAPVVYLLVALWVVFGNLYQGMSDAKLDTIWIGCAVLAAGAIVYLPWRWLVTRAERT